MLKTNPVVEGGVLAGNVFDKYNTRNPIARRLMRGFLEAACALVRASGEHDVHEVGCGEGMLSLHLATQIAGLRIRGSDISAHVLATARENAADASVAFEVTEASIYHLDPKIHAASLIVCCEVLEHLEEPDRAVEVLSALARPHLLVSVPREPMWRVLNMARGKYLRAWGNTPGHLNHWSPKTLVGLLRTRFDIEQLRMPVPWLMALCRVQASG